MKPLHIFLRIAGLLGVVFIPYYLGNVLVWVLGLDDKYILAHDKWAGGIVVALALVVIPYGVYATIRWILTGK